MNRNPKTNCGSCIYYHPPNGECRKLTPGPRMYWPVVQAFDWCGEYEADLYVTHPETDHALEFKWASMMPSPFWPTYPSEFPEETEELKCTGASKSRQCRGEVTLVPCPYASDVNNDQTPVWLCEECRYQRAQDI